MKFILENKEEYYTQGSFIKKSGEEKSYFAPKGDLRRLQWIINERYLSRWKVSENAKAYRKGLSILDNARVHRFSKHFLKLDIQNFFNSIGEELIVSSLMSRGLSQFDSQRVFEVATLGERLIYGAITSPSLSNIVMYEFDKKVEEFLKRFHPDIAYSRYSDDMTFSSSTLYMNFKDIEWFVRKLLKDMGLKLNEKKTKVVSLNSRVCITGLVVSSSKYDFGNDGIGIGRVNKRKIRAEIHNLLSSKDSKTKI